LKIRELRKQQYEYNIGGYPFLDDWKRNPYTFLKMRFYMEVSSVLIYWFLRVGIKPNTLTMIYISCGIVGGVLLSIPMKITIYLALFIFFSKSIIDNCDGHVARITNRVSLTGGILDNYGSLINSLGFWGGFGFYLAHYTGSNIFYYLIPVLFFFYAADLHQYASYQIVHYAAWDRKKIHCVNSSIGYGAIKSSYRLVRGAIYIFEYFCNFIQNKFPDDRARTVDLVCTFIILELHSEFFISWILFILFFLKKFILFIFSVHAIVNKNWVDKIIHNIWRKRAEI